MLCSFSKITVACRDTKHACSLSYIWSSTPSNIRISNSPLTLLLSTFIGFRLEPGILIRYCLSPNIHTSNCPLNSVLSTFISLRLELAEAVAGSAAWLGRGLSCVCAQRRDSDAGSFFDLTLAQEECLERLQRRIEVPYDGSIVEHQEALKALWKVAFPEEELRGLISEQWKEMGWQGKDPSTDFRGGGFISLENFLFFARNFPKSFQDLLWKREGDRSVWEYPFAVAGVNITFMLVQMLDLEAVKPRTLVGATFLKFLEENESAFDLLYCIAFKLMDHQWLSMRASYMDFNTVMKSTRQELEKELLQEVSHLEDLPSYKLLSR